MFHIIFFFFVSFATPFIVQASMGQMPSYIPTMETLSQLPSDYTVGRPLTVSDALLQQAIQPPAPEPVAEPEPEEGEDDEQPMDVDDWEGCSG